MKTFPAYFHFTDSLSNPMMIMQKPPANIKKTHFKAIISCFIKVWQILSENQTSKGFQYWLPEHKPMK